MNPELRKLYFKPGVDWRGVRALTWDGVMTALAVCESRGVECVVTSMTDGAAGRVANSKHRTGLAFDLRTSHIEKAADREALRAALAAALGKDWDVILHAVATGAEHIHAEFDPKPFKNNKA